MAITPVTIQTVAQERKVLEPTKFQADLDNLAGAINSIISVLESLASGESGAEYVNSRPVGTLNSSAGGSIYTLLNAMFTYIGAVQAGTIADGSLGAEKLSFDPVTAEELVTALAGVQMEVTGAASAIIDADLTASRILVSGADGKVAVSLIASSLLSYLSGLTGNIQDQMDLKATIAALSAASSASSSALSSAVSTINSALAGKLGSTAKAADSDKIDGYHVWVSSSAPPDASYIWIQI